MMGALSIRARLRSLTAIVALAVTASCGGGFNTPNGPVVGSPGGGGPPPTKLVDVKVTVTIPAAGSGVRPNYLSYNTESLSIQLVSVDGQGVTGVNPTIMNTLPKSHDCKTGSQGTVCTNTAKGSAGDDVFSVTAYDGPGATGAVLSVGSVATKIAGSGGSVGISNRVPLSLGGVIAKLKLWLVPTKGKRGHHVTVAITLEAYDASGAQIVGPSDYSAPISLAVQGDTSHAFRLHAGGRSGESLTIAKPMSNVSLTYDGNPQASAVSIAATVDSGPSSPGATANFDLTGHPPPPPVGTIYALNFGATGQSATITEYDGQDKGNAPPVRTLTLDKKLYAVSLAVASSGNIYVGYFDNSMGYNPANGSPDPGNEIAIYAPDANGNDQPTAVLVQDPKTATTIFPIFITFDPTGRLVTYGATNLVSYAADSVLMYKAGSKGAAAPEDYFVLSSPTIHYSGPSGLGIDSQNNFYLNGTFKSGFSSVGGLYVAPAANIKNHQVTPSRSIPWNSSQSKLPIEVTDVALNQSGEIFIANVLKNGSGSGTTCQAAVNVYSAGAASGGVAPLRTMTLEGMKTEGTDCTNAFNPLLFYFPEIQMYGGSTLFAADPYNDAIDEFASTGKGPVTSSVRIAGSATQLNGPVALAITSVSGPAKAGSVTGVHAPVRDPFKQRDLFK